MNINSPCLARTHLLAGACFVASSLGLNAQIVTQNGYLVDTALSPVTVALSYNQNFSPMASSAAFGTLTSPDKNLVASAKASLAPHFPTESPDPMVSASVNEGSGTYFASASVTYQMIVVPDAAPAFVSPDSVPDVLVDIEGDAGITIGPEAFYDSAYPPSATLTFSGPSILPENLVSVDTLSSGNPISGGTADVPFDLLESLNVDQAYTVTISATAGYNADPAENLSAWVDPFAIISPLAVDPNFEIAYSPGFQFVSNVPPPAPDGAPTWALLGLSALLLAIVTKRHKAAA